MTQPHLMIAGGGIGGLATALTLHQIGVPCTVFEAAREMRPLGVGINIQPNAVRELYDMGVGAQDLDTVGLPACEWAPVGLNGNDIYAEPRGVEAAHRGAFHMLLFRTFIARAGVDAVRLGQRITGYRQTAEITRPDGTPSTAQGSLLLTIKAMKMETGIHAERDVTVKAVNVQPGGQIDAKNLLVELE